MFSDRLLSGSRILVRVHEESIVRKQSCEVYGTFKKLNQTTVQKKSAEKKEENQDGIGLEYSILNKKASNWQVN